MQLQKFAIAGQLCAVFGLNLSVVCENWACLMFQQHKARFLDLVLSRVREYPAIDFLRLSDAAMQMGLDGPEVAKIVAFVREPKLRFFFLRDNLRLEDDAKTCVLESLDGDAVVSYLVLLKLTSMKRGRGVEAARSQFEAVLQSNPVFIQHYLAYRKHCDPGVFQRVRPMLTPLRRMALELVHLEPPPHAELLQVFAKDKGGEAQGFVGVLKATVGYQQLEKQQYADEAPARSARARVVQLIAAGDARAADKVANQFGIDARTMCWTRLRTYLKYNMADELMAMGAGSALPVAWELLAEECFVRGQRQAGLVFTQRVKDYAERHRMLARNEFWEEAAQVAQTNLRDARLAEEDRQHIPT